MTAVETAFNPVIGGAITVLIDDVLAFGIDAIELRTLGQDLADAVGDRAMGVFHGLHRRVMFTVHRCPLAGIHAGRQPQPQAEKMGGQRVQINRAMGLIAMQIDGDAGGGDLGKNKRDECVSPPRHNHES